MFNEFLAEYLTQVNFVGLVQIFSQVVLRGSLFVSKTAKCSVHTKKPSINKDLK